MSHNEPLSAAVNGYLAMKGFTAVLTDELEALRERPVFAEPKPICPYPIFLEGWGPSHRRYLGQICKKEDNPLSGLVVMRCEACGNVEFVPNVAVAGGSSEVGEWVGKKVEKEGE